MATSGAMSTSNQYIKYTITITQNSQSIEDNTSNVTVSVRFYRTNTGYESYGSGNVYCKIDGIEYSQGVVWTQKITNSGIVLFSKTLNISHGSDGTKKLTCSAWISHEVVTSSEQSYSQTLSTIYRASKPTCSKSATMKGTLTINTNRNSASFTHTLKYTFGGTTETIATGVGGSYPWTVPDLAHLCNNRLSDTCTITCITYNGSTKIGEETCTTTVNVPAKTVPSFPNGDVIIGGGNPIATNAGSKNFSHLITYSFNGKTGDVNSDKVKSGIVWWTPYDLATAIKASPSGNGTITCKTYNGTALVGTSDPVSFKAVVPDNSTTRPSFGSDGFVLTPSGPENILTNFSGLYIQGKTGVKAEFTASSTYSSIASYKLSVDGRVYTGNPATSNTLTKDGNIEVTGTVTDARGYYTTVPTTIAVIPYSIPRIEPYDGDKEIICERSDQDGVYTPSGTHLHIRAKMSYYPVNQKNICHLKYRYKASGGSWSSEKTLLSGSDTSTDKIDIVIPDVVTETDKTYLVQLIVEDTIGEKIPYDFPIPTDKVTLHLGEGGHGVSVGKYSEATADNELFESEWDAKFYGNLHANHIAGLGLYDGEDFNELVDKTGYYTGTSAPSSTKCSNYPVDKTGVLEVISAMKQNAETLAWWGFAYQTYRTHDGEVYMRSYYTSTGFTAWKKVQFST